jgi:homocysteine S-methyltransferase
MRQAGNPEAARAEGIRIAQEILVETHRMVQGVQIRGPFAEYETSVEVLSCLRGVSQ